MSTVATQVKTHRFYAKGRKELLVRRGQHDLVTAMGTLMRQQDRVVYDFAPGGTLEVYEGQDMLPDGPLDPETLEPTVQDAVAWLDSHPLLNSRFWHEGAEPDRPLPTEDDFMELLTDAAVTLALEPVQVALAQERETHNRPLLVKAAERTLAQIEAMRAQELAKQEGASPPAE